MRLEEMLVMGVLFVALGITLAIGASVTNTVYGQFTAGSTAAMAAANATAGIGNLSTWLPTIGTVIAAAVIISLIVGAFVSFGGRRQE